MTEDPRCDTRPPESLGRLVAGTVWNAALIELQRVLAPKNRLLGVMAEPCPDQAPCLPTLPGVRGG
jgi:hypothetical protein